MKNAIVIVTDLILGVDLEKLVRYKDKMITEEEARNLIHSLVKAVADMHSLGRNIIHRDLHLKNVMISFNNIKITKDALEDP